MTSKTAMSMAESLVDAVQRLNASGLTDDEATEDMIGAESAICEHLDISLDETEQGLTPNAVAVIESFVSEEIGRPWGYDQQ